MQKKAQARNMEIIFIVLFLFLFFTIGLITYLKIKGGDIEEISRKTADITAAKIAQNIMSINQLQCNIDNYKEDNCIELQKLNSLKQIIDNDLDNLYYFDIFSYSKITFDYYLKGISKQTINLYDKSKTAGKFKSKTHFFTPIIIYDSFKKERYFGILTLEVYP